jgi:hypothetical protein
MFDGSAIISGRHSRFREVLAPDAARQKPLEKQNTTGREMMTSRTVQILPGASNCLMPLDLESNASSFIKLVSGPTGGIPMWQPSEDGDVGEFGYLDTFGCWVKVRSRLAYAIQNSSRVIAIQYLRFGQRIRVAIARLASGRQRCPRGHVN